MDTQYQLSYNLDHSGATAVITAAELTNYVKQVSGIAAEDTLIASILSAGLEQAERMTMNQLYTTVDVSLFVDIDEPASDGTYEIILPFGNSTIAALTSISAIDRDGDAVTVDSDDYRLKGNILILKMTGVYGYRFTIAYTATVAEANLARFKEVVLAFLGYKYMFRSTKDVAKDVELLEPIIDYKGWM